MPDITYALASNGVYGQSGGRYVDSLQTITMVDSFEDGGITEYTGDTAGYSVNTDSGVAQDGSNYLSRDGGGYAQIESTSGLNAYPQQGDRFAVWVRTGDGSTSASYHAPMWGLASASTRYYARPKYGDQLFELVLDSGTTSENVTLAQNTWYEVEIEWDDGSTFGGAAGDHTATLYESDGTQIAQVTGNDNTRSSGGIGFGTTDEGLIDYYHIKNR